YPYPEWVPVWYVLECLVGRGDWLSKACCIGDDLGHLGTGGVVLPLKVWSVERRDTCSGRGTSTWIPSHHTVHGEAFYPHPEWVGGRDVLVGLLGGRDWLREASSVRHH